VGVWLPQTEATFNVRVTDVDAPSYISHSVADVLAMAEDEHKWKYMVATELVRHPFTIL